MAIFFFRLMYFIFDSIDCVLSDSLNCIRFVSHSMDYICSWKEQFRQYFDKRGSLAEEVLIWSLLAWDPTCLPIRLISGLGWVNSLTMYGNFVSPKCLRILRRDLLLIPPFFLSPPPLQITKLSM